MEAVLSDGIFARPSGLNTLLRQTNSQTFLSLELFDVDAAYQDFCNIIKKAAKKTIPRDY